MTYVSQGLYSLKALLRPPSHIVCVFLGSAAFNAEINLFPSRKESTNSCSANYTQFGNILKTNGIFV